MALDSDVLPRRFPPNPDPSLPLRVARIRLKVALLAVDEAIAGQRPQDAAVVALENVAHAERELKRWIAAEIER